MHAMSRGLPASVDPSSGCLGMHPSGCSCSAHKGSQLPFQECAGPVDACKGSHQVLSGTVHAWRSLCCRTTYIVYADSLSDEQCW
jgi:hypothetical protein